MTKVIFRTILFGDEIWMRFLRMNLIMIGGYNI